MADNKQEYMMQIFDQGKWKMVPWVPIPKVINI